MGMGHELASAFPEARALFEQADSLLELPLSELCFKGPEEELLKTEIQQPAIFTVSMATLAALRSLGLEAGAAAGHSLGEYSALASVGALSFQDGLRLTRERGRQMASIARRTGGIMAAIIGLTVESVEGICHKAASQGVVEVANFNSPTQTVISGDEPATRKAMELARSAGARRVIELPVSAPFHSSLMKPLARSFGPHLQSAAIADARMPVVANVNARAESNAADIRANLIEQLFSPVRWTESIETLVVQGFDTFIEVGPGKVLTGLTRTIAPTARAFHTNDLSSLEETAAAA